MKEDVPPLGPVPKKRRQLETALDVHVAMWLASDTLTPSERRRVQDEKDRRKMLVPDRPVGLLIGREGVTPQQRAALIDTINKSGATEVHHPGVAAPIHAACRNLGVPVHEHDGDLRAVVEACDRATGRILAAPNNDKQQGPVIDAVRHARHRGLATSILVPSGMTKENT